jgi:tRNA pseudouridine32 synthase/23S rRNA pseudouridine746 synthase
MCSKPFNRPHTHVTTPCDAEVNIVYEDEHLLVAEKPPFLLSVPGRLKENQDSLLARLQESHPGVSIVHRLDMDTSGLMVLARNKASHRSLSSLFQRREVHKQYTAVVAGHMAESSGSIELPLAKDWPNRPLQKIDFVAGKPSLTHYQVVDRPQARHTRLLLTPITGRSHQLRLHLRAIGHPILGCDLYGNEYAYEQSERLLLHASKLSFPHPQDLRSMGFDSIPDF